MRTIREHGESGECRLSAHSCRASGSPKSSQFLRISTVLVRAAGALLVSRLRDTSNGEHKIVLRKHGKYISDS
jgi:hypothetical protein